MFTLTRRTNDLDRPFRSLFTTFANEPFFAGFPVEVSDGDTLAVDVSEKDDQTIIRASLPGFDRESVDVQFHDGVLTITAEHNEETDDSGETYHTRERVFRSLQRSMRLPQVAHDGKASAELVDGVLTVKLPHAANARPRKISVN